MAAARMLQPVHDRVGGRLFYRDILQVVYRLHLAVVPVEHAPPGAEEFVVGTRARKEPWLVLDVPEQVAPLEELEKRAKGRLDVAVKARHRKRADGGTVSVITDPDGNRIELREPRPR